MTVLNWHNIRCNLILGVYSNYHDDDQEEYDNFIFSMFFFLIVLEAFQWKQ